MILQRVYEGRIAAIIGIWYAGEVARRYARFTTEGEKAVKPSVLGGIIGPNVVGMPHDLAEELRQLFPGRVVIEDGFHAPSNVPLPSPKSKSAVEGGETL